MDKGGNTTVLLGDARDPDRHLRVTWHPDSQTVVFSHWHGAVCAASTPVRLTEASRLVDLLTAALRPPAGAGVAGGSSGSGFGASGAHEGGQ